MFVSSMHVPILSIIKRYFGTEYELSQWKLCFIPREDFDTIFKRLIRENLLEVMQAQLRHRSNWSSVKTVKIFGFA